MDENTPDGRPRPFITKLMEERSRKEIDEANDSFLRYVDIVRGIHECLETASSIADGEMPVRPITNVREGLTGQERIHPPYCR